MNTHHTPAPGLVHSSVRTSLATNSDATTGNQSRTLITSRLEMRWIGDDLNVRFSGLAFEMDAAQMAEHRARRRMRRGV